MSIGSMTMTTTGWGRMVHALLEDEILFVLVLVLVIIGVSSAVYWMKNLRIGLRIVATACAMYFVVFMCFQLYYSVSLLLPAAWNYLVSYYNNSNAVIDRVYYMKKIWDNQ